MKYRKLGKTNVEVSEISLGCWTMGGLNWVNGVPNGWANVDEHEIKQAIFYAIDHGVNHFDNADVYGNGRAERLLAKALGDKSKDVIIATKIGYFLGTAEHAYEPAHIRHQCEQSLKNLKRDHIDIYYFHNANFGPKDCYLDEAIEMMGRLKEEGKVRVIGQSDYSADAICRVIPKVKPQVIQSWASILDDHYIREGTRLHKMMTDGKMTYVVFSPLAQGLLLGKYKAESPPQFQSGDIRLSQSRFKKEALKELEPKIQKLKSRFGETIPDLSRAALQYLLHNEVVSCVIPGFRNQRQVEANLAGANCPLSNEDVEFIRDVFK